MSGPPRRFDYDEARARRAEGETFADIGRALGVTANAVRRVVLEEVRVRDAASTARWTRSARCPDCGAQTTRHRTLFAEHGDDLERPGVTRAEARTLLDTLDAAVRERDQARDALRQIASPRFIGGRDVCKEIARAALAGEQT